MVLNTRRWCGIGDRAAPRDGLSGEEFESNAAPHEKPKAFYADKLEKPIALGRETTISMNWQMNQPFFDGSGNGGA